MKALIIEKPGHLKVDEIPEPKMGDYDARCEQLYGATCTGTDLAVINGTFEECEVDYPSVIGHESVGRVIEIGEKVRNYKIGDLITRVGTRENGDMMLSWGGMCEYGLACDHQAMLQDGIDINVWAEKRVNRVIPQGIIEPLDATMIITWRETLSYIQRIGVEEGCNVLISGSGGNGIALGAMAAIKGAQVTMVGSSGRSSSSINAGISQYVNYKDTNAVAQLMEEKRDAFHFIIDATGKSGSLNPYMPCLKKNGTIGIYGMDDLKRYGLNPNLGPSHFHIYNGGYDEPETHEQVMDLIRAQKLDAGNWLDRENIFTWENAPEAYEHVRKKKAIKSVIKLSR